MPAGRPFTEPQSQFGRFLRQQREEAGLSQNELCELASLSHSHVPILELGYAHPREETARRLAAALGVPYEEMWGVVEESRHGYSRRESMPQQDATLFPNKTYLTLDVTEWLEQQARATSRSKSHVMAHIISREFYGKRKAASA